MRRVGEIRLATSALTIAALDVSNGRAQLWTNLTVDQEVGGSKSTQLYQIDQTFQPFMRTAVHGCKWTGLSGPAADLAEQGSSFRDQS